MSKDAYNFKFYKKTKIFVQTPVHTPWYNDSIYTLTTDFKLLLWVYCNWKKKRKKKKQS